MEIELWKAVKFLAPLQIYRHRKIILTLHFTITNTSSFSDQINPSVEILELLESVEGLRVCWYCSVNNFEFTSKVCQDVDPLEKLQRSWVPCQGLYVVLNIMCTFTNYEAFWEVIHGLLTYMNKINNWPKWNCRREKGIHSVTQLNSHPFIIAQNHPAEWVWWLMVEW